MASEKFKITYAVDDGYISGDRPQHTSITADELDGGETDQDLKDLFWEEIQRHFNENIRPFSPQEDEFIAWARAHMPKEEE
jgi:hypothetical protein